MTNAMAEDLADYMSDNELVVEPKLPKLDESFGCTVVISNLPKVPQPKHDKLKSVVLKICNKVGTVDVRDEVAPLMPSGEDGKSFGFLFITFKSSADATKCEEAVNGYQFDKNHKINVVKYDEVKKLKTVADTYEEESASPYEPSPDTSWWLRDPSQRDAFCIRYGNETEVHWADGSREPVLDHDGGDKKASGVQWCNYYMEWSSRGSIMATILPAKGVITWGGPNYKKLKRFSHVDVETVQFSPEEGYMMTTSFKNDIKDAIKIWNTKTGKLLRAFPLFPSESFKEKDAEKPPPFLWSHNDEYIARMGEDLISIYELPSMKLLEKKSLLANGIAEFQWSPAQNILAYWAPEKGNAPAHIQLVEIPSRKHLRQKNLFQVSKVNMSWHDQGKFLGCKVLRHTKTKKTVYNNFELFRVHEDGIPVEILEIKDAVFNFRWEPQGTRFAMVHAENRSATRASVSFYDMNKEVTHTERRGPKGSKKQVTVTQTVSELNLVSTLKDRQCNSLYWSPAGNIIVMASLGDTSSGSLEFFDVNTCTTMAVREHYRATEVSWDPSGRILSTSVLQPLTGGYFKFQMDNGYMLWSFQGKQLKTVAFQNFFQFAWRPRKNLLGEEKRSEIKANLKKYYEEFDRRDKEKARALYLEETRGKRELRSKFRDRVEVLRAGYDANREQRKQMNDGYDSEDEDMYVIQTANVETVLKTDEFLVES
ncbi:hypothetical protein TrRE_jg6945, partial [Triparma retinervis]